MKKHLVPQVAICMSSVTSSQLINLYIGLWSIEIQSMLCFATIYIYRFENCGRISDPILLGCTSVTRMPEWVSTVLVYLITQHDMPQKLDVHAPWKFHFLSENNMK
jgi:hypothetical protein